MASSSSSIPVRQIKHDVFISFRGSDTRHGFLSHLTKELRQKQIDVYADERLETGDEISSALVNAIKASEISLIIFSEHYASSKWCLDELAKVMECKEANGQIVIPVFYNVDPSHVRHQQGTYGDAFAKHEQRFKDNMEKLQNWGSALTKVANLSGYHYPSKFENESTLIDKIVKDVLDKLDDNNPIEPRRLVGFDGNFACVEELLEFGSQEVLILGIWGMGGIGKTTLAHAVCEKFSSQFESCCFLENVREESKKINGLSYLLQKLVSELLDEENLCMNNAMKARSIWRRLHRKKVLIVLDDVDASEKLEYLLGEQLFLAPGSRVIVTSRDKHVLVSRGVQAIYEVKKLDFQESLKLFSLNAFNQRHPKMGYEELSERAINYAKGNPLALKVLGLHFHSRNKETWESELKKLQKYPNMRIQNVLKVSYDGLDQVEKDTFLDIVFFFKGRCKDDIIRVLDACGLYAHSGIANLVDKALITISSRYGETFIEIHDLLQEMGEQIVREESIKNPGRRSRLRDVEEIYDVLKNNMGTDTVEGIILDVSQIKNVHLSADTFKKMTNLRILDFYKGWQHNSCNVNLPFGLESFSNKLSYFHWYKCPLKSLPLGFCPKKLVELHMEYSSVRKLWDGVQDLVNLKILSLSQCHQLMELPDFSMACNLNKVILRGCKSLCSIHPSILQLRTLVSLDLGGCEELKILQSESHLKSLQWLNVERCIGLKEFSLSFEKMTYLSLSYLAIEILHSSIGRCNNLKFLRLNGSRLQSLEIHGLSCLTSLESFELTDFRQVIGKMELHNLFDGLRSLRSLYLHRCDKLIEIPDNISTLTLLGSLSLDGSSVMSLPVTIKHLSNLKSVSLINCRMLRSILALPPFIEDFDATGCSSLETVCSLTPMPKAIRCKFAFQNCVKLDEHSIHNIMELAFFLMVAAICGDIVDFHVRYPRSTVPKWIRYHHTTKAFITVEVAPPFHQLLGFVFWCVLPEFVWEKPISVSCRYYVNEERCWDRFLLHGHDFVSDHVLLWYERCPYVFRNAQRNYDNGITPSLACEICAQACDGTISHVKLDGLIKASGVRPIYTSDYDNLLREIGILKLEMDRKTKKHAQIENKEQLRPTKRSKESCIIPRVSLELELDQFSNSLREIGTVGDGKKNKEYRRRRTTTSNKEVQQIQQKWSTPIGILDHSTCFFGLGVRPVRW